MKGTGGKRREKGRAGERGGKEGEWNEEMVGILSTSQAVLPAIIISTSIQFHQARLNLTVG